MAGVALVGGVGCSEYAVAGCASGFVFVGSVGDYLLELFVIWCFHWL